VNAPIVAADSTVDVVALPAFDLSGRVAIITGASSGLGSRFARVLHAHGASVVLAARRAERLSSLRAQLRRSVAVPCDVTDAADRDRLMMSAQAAFGKVDVLVNNAGVSGPPEPGESFPLDRWARTMDVNLTSVFALSQLVARSMLERGRGSIINIASILGPVAGAPMMDAAYAASRGAILNLTRELAVEWAERQVRVNAIAPGWFETEMTASMVGDPGSERYVRRGCPMRRMGRANELDGVLLLLASDASTYITGQTLTVDGGWTSR